MFYFLFSVKTSIITPIKAIIPKGILHKIKNGTMKINNTSIENAIIENNCKIISNTAFSNCRSLSSLIIPNSVIFIGNSP
jgi:NDP-sugar pyrophosphorylase family protein